MPDFKEAPYDLGSFDEISHHRGSRAASFLAGFSIGGEADSEYRRYQYECKLSRKVGLHLRPSDYFVPYRTLGLLKSRMEANRDSRLSSNLEPQTGHGKVLFFPPNLLSFRAHTDDRMWPPAHNLQAAPERYSRRRGLPSWSGSDGSPEFSPDDLEKVRILSHVGGEYYHRDARVFASAPVRSKPRRTYDPSRPTPDPEGDYVPMYLANLVTQNPTRWESLKELLEKYGENAGLFDEISIKRLGKRDSEPFQVQVRKIQREAKGPFPESHRCGLWS